MANDANPTADVDLLNVRQHDLVAGLQPTAHQRHVGEESNDLWPAFLDGRRVGVRLDNKQSLANKGYAWHRNDGFMSTARNLSNDKRASGHGGNVVDRSGDEEDTSALD